MTIVEFLNQLKNPIDPKFHNKKLAYAILDGYEVVIYDKENEDEGCIFQTDMYTIIHEIMHDRGLEDGSP